jgi:hypothetical protein
MRLRSAGKEYIDRHAVRHLDGWVPPSPLSTPLLFVILHLREISPNYSLQRGYRQIRDSKRVIPGFGTVRRYSPAPKTAFAVLSPPSKTCGWLGCGNAALRGRRPLRGGYTGFAPGLPMVGAKIPHRRLFTHSLLFLSVTNRDSEIRHVKSLAIRRFSLNWGLTGFWGKRIEIRVDSQDQ